MQLAKLTDSLRENNFNYVRLQDALKDNFKPPAKPWFDFGAGLNLELDEGSLQPTVRLKVKDFFSIKVGFISLSQSSKTFSQIWAKNYNF